MFGRRIVLCFQYQYDDDVCERKVVVCVESHNDDYEISGGSILAPRYGLSPKPEA